MDRIRISLTVIFTALALVAAVVLFLRPDAPRALEAVIEAANSDRSLEAEAAFVGPSISTFRLRFAVLDIDAPIEEFVAPAEGSQLPAPDGPGYVGWYRSIVDGDVGEHGLLVGHVNWHDGSPAVFERLAEAKPGDTLELDDGQVTRRYRVVAVRDVDAFTTPLAAIMSTGSQDSVTLITCSGEYLWDAGMYAERRVVLAVRENDLTSASP